MNSFLDFDIKLCEAGRVVVGIDEVGRGPAAGPMVFALFAFNKRLAELSNLNDSKKLSEKKRISLTKEFMTGSYKFTLSLVWPSEIDDYGLSKSSSIAIYRCIESFKLFYGIEPEFFCLDGNLKMPAEYSDSNSKVFVKGDTKLRCIAAASVIAKVFRDNMMKGYENLESFSFGKHKAYLTELHKNEMKKYGLSRIHRKSYKINLDV